MLVSSPKISIVMPVYNGERYLEETLKSLLTQTFSDFELLVIDNCSTDSTPDMVEQANDPRIRYLRNDENKGISHSANRGIEEARGKYIARTDADDISLPHRLERQFAFMEANPDVVVCSGHLQYIGQWNAILSLPQEHDVIKAHLPFYTSIAQPAAFFRREFLLRHDLRYNSEFDSAEDLDLWFRISHDHGGRLANIQEVLLQYRIHAESTTVTKKKKQDDAAFAVRQRYLADWGFSLSEERLALHRALSCGSPLWSKEAFQNIADWFTILREANETKPIYASFPWRVMLAYTLMKIVQNNLHLGPGICRKLQEYPDFGLLQISDTEMRLLLEAAARARIKAGTSLK